MPQKITVPDWKEGGTLSSIATKYGVTVEELQKANGIADPNKIQKGMQLIIPDKAGPSSDLENTLTPEKTLPEGTPADRLSSFRNLLKTVSNRAGQDAKVAGVGISGVDPSKVSGGTLKGVMDFVGRQKTQGISDIYKSTTTFLDNQQKQAQEHLKTLINSGAIAQMTDDAIAKLATTSGMDYDMLQAIRTQKKAESEKPASSWTGNINGQQVRINFDKMGNETSRTVLGKAGNPTDPSKTTKNSWNSLGQAQKEAVIGWMAKQPGFSGTDLQKIDEDPEFSAFIIGEYYKQNSL